MTKVWTSGFDEIVNLFDSYRTADKRLSRLADDLASVCIRETTHLTHEPRGGNGVPELQRYVEMREDKRDKLLEQLSKVSGQFEKVVELTNQLSGAEFDVIQRYYIVGWPMHRVSQMLNYSVRQCWRYRDDAFYRLAKTWHNMAQ